MSAKNKSSSSMAYMCASRAALVAIYMCCFIISDAEPACDGWAFDVELDMDSPVLHECYSERVTVTVSEMVAPESCIVEACAPGAIGPNCTSCIPGYARFDTACVACPVDYFNPLYDDGACEPCELGMSTLGLVGQTACWGCFERCTVCPDGFVLWTDTCRQCAPGSYSYSANQTCMACPPGSYSAMGKQCLPCPAGSYAPTSLSTACALCPTHSHSPQPGASQCTCSPGAALDYLSAVCAPCLAGYYSVDGGQCTPCPSGTACNQTGCFKCATCSQNYFAANIASIECLPCVGVAATADTCLCPPGTFGSSAAIFNVNTQCSSCASTCGADSFIEQLCQPLSDLRCAKCSSKCASGMYVTKECDATMDITCKRCSTMCLGGYFVSKGCDRALDQICSKCASSCAIGHVLIRPCSAASDIVCEPCPPGSFALATGTCQKCQDGYYQPTAGSTACIECALLTDAGQTQCYLCPPGHYRATRYACAACPPMTFGSNGGCESCVGGNFRESGATMCVNPPIG